MWSPPWQDAPVISALLLPLAFFAGPFQPCVPAPSPTNSAFHGRPAVPEAPKAVEAPRAESSGQQDPGDPALRKAWEKLEPKEKADLVEWFRYEVGNLRTLQAYLVEQAIRSRDEDVGLAPMARAPRYFDPEEHAPKLPIPRKWLEPDSKAVERVRKKLLGQPDPRSISRSWAYDWGQRKVVRTGPANDPEVLFANALLGLAPDTDIAVACILEALDLGEEQDVLEAFDHTYTDRKGNAYTGITLYDAWGSGRPLEMPDVDNLGIVHTLLGIKRRWRSPVPDKKQESLYEKVGEQYTRAKRYRGLREALASVYLAGEPAVPAGYETSILRFHALWEEASSDPHELSQKLPGADDWKRFLERLLKRVSKDRDLSNKAQARQARLLRDQAAIRATLVRIMGESGALKK